MKIRVGFGFDVHQLVEGRELWLGGIRLEHTHGLLGHSDADVLIHAICDALLGAANMRDIGYHFPDNSQEFHNIDSKILLRKTVELIATKGYRVGNIDATICAERPKLKAHIPAMQECLAKVMDIDIDDVSIKETWLHRSRRRHLCLLHRADKQRIRKESQLLPYPLFYITEKLFIFFSSYRRGHAYHPGRKPKRNAWSDPEG